MNKDTFRLLKSGKSIVASLVDIGVNSHRPLEAMTNEILSIHSKYAHAVSNKEAFLDYLTKELKTAEKQYINLIRSYQ
jgi:hypothetical protein